MCDVDPEVELVLRFRARVNALTFDKSTRSYRVPLLQSTLALDLVSGEERHCIIAASPSPLPYDLERFIECEIGNAVVANSEHTQ